MGVFVCVRACVHACACVYVIACAHLRDVPRKKCVFGNYMSRMEKNMSRMWICFYVWRNEKNVYL